MEIWIPDSAKAAFVCNVPQDDGTSCGKRFTRDERSVYERHVVACATRNEEAIHEQSPRNRLEVLQPWDPEYAAHMREVGKRMIREGRLETRPNER